MSFNACMCSMHLVHHLSTTLRRNDNSSTTQHTAMFIFHVHSVHLSTHGKQQGHRQKATHTAQEILMQMSQNRIMHSPLTDLLGQKQSSSSSIIRTLSSGSETSITGSGSLEKQSASGSVLHCVLVASARLWIHGNAMAGTMLLLTKQGQKRFVNRHNDEPPAKHILMKLLKTEEHCSTFV